jgi:hypothetical protein
MTSVLLSWYAWLDDTSKHNSILLLCLAASCFRIFNCEPC